MNLPAQMGEAELQALKRICDLLTSNEGIQLALILHRDGQILVSSGDRQDIDLASIAALSAGILAGAKGMANLVNENELLCVFHEGVNQKLLISPIEDDTILTVHFDQRKTLGWVRFQARKHMHELAVSARRLMHNFEIASPALGTMGEDDFESLHFGNFFPSEGGSN